MIFTFESGISQVLSPPALDELHSVDYDWTTEDVSKAEDVQLKVKSNTKFEKRPWGKSFVPKFVNFRMSHDRQPIHLLSGARKVSFLSDWVMGLAEKGSIPSF